MQMNRMKKWLEDNGAFLGKKAAERASTSLGVLRQIAGSYRTGGVPHTTPSLAREIEEATSFVTRGADVVLREHLCPACGRCELAKAARKTEAKR